MCVIMMTLEVILDLSHGISFFQNFEHTIHTMMAEEAELRRENQELKGKIQEMEQKIQELKLQTEEMEKQVHNIVTSYIHTIMPKMWEYKNYDVGYLD